MVLIAQLLPRFLFRGPGIAGDNAVHQSGCKNAGLLHPFLKPFGQAPVVNLPHHTFFQHNTVVVDEFHRQHHQAPGGIALESLEPVI